MAIGLSFPFALATGSLGYLEPTSDIVSAISSNVRSLLLTNWGERVMHFDLGCNMIEFVFEQKTKQVRGRIADRVKSQLAKWMPFLNLAVLNVLFEEDDPNIPDNGFAVKMQLTYGNIPIDLFLLFPTT